MTSQPPADSATGQAARDAFEAADVPTLRRDLLTWLRDGRGLHFHTTMSHSAGTMLGKPHLDGDPATMRGYAEMVIAQETRTLRAAELYYVTPEMTALVREAAADTGTRPTGRRSANASASNAPPAGANARASAVAARMSAAARTGTASPRTAPARRSSSPPRTATTRPRTATTTTCSQPVQAVTCTTTKITTRRPPRAPGRPPSPPAWTRSSR